MTDARLDMIRSYVSRGWAPVPLPARSKNPGFNNWESFVVTENALESTFPPTRNVGLILGEPSHGLVDVDLDSAESRALAPLILEPTEMIHGHTQKPSSHWWYVADPIPAATVRRRDVDGATLCELRSTGGQTIVPPSIHPDGPAIVWERDGEPAMVDGRIIAAQVDRLAAASLLARHWPAQGSRHDLALAVSGALLRHGWDTGAVESFVSAVIRVAGDTEAFDRERAIRDTARAVRGGKHTTGIPTMVDIIGQRVVDRFCDWLGIGERVESMPDEPLILLPSEPRIWPDILAKHQVATGHLPYWMMRLVSHIRPFTPMFPDDWPIMTSLTYWSTLWPSVRIQNLNLALWMLGLGTQGVGKNQATDELTRVIRGITGSSRDQSMAVYTAGSPEGMWDSLAGSGKQMLCYHDEFGGFLKLLQRDHMQSAREALCSLYDGRVVGYLRARKEGVEVYDPHVVVCATTTPAAIRQFATLEDLTNGYLSRFMVCAPDSVSVAASYDVFNDAERRSLIDEIGKHLERFRDIGRVEWQDTGRADPELLRDYGRHLGLATGKRINLDEAGDDTGIPAGRLVARIKKIAALLELAEEYPDMNADRTAVAIRGDHLVTAIDIVECDRAYALRIRDWIGTSRDVELGQRALKYLWSNKSAGMSQRELCRRLHASSSEMRIALDLLGSEGQAHSVKQGRMERWFAGPESSRRRHDRHEGAA